MLIDQDSGTYLRHCRNKDFVIDVWVVIERILVASELHRHLDAILFGRLLFVLDLSVFGGLHTVNYNS